ncbi:MAG: hypothetical protein ACPLZD_00760 [Candidatus Saccharicenans sp.]|nr:MAG: hypothetical protein C0168_01515 [Candidatus Aminicenantes bacterium]HEK85139.1 hypothetical protein [Candidatus Aminicenantes bacterium]
MKKKYGSLALILGIATLVFFLATLFSACEGKKKEAAESTRVVEMLSLEQLKPILGEAREDSSGAVDVSGDTNRLMVSYRYFNPNRKDYDDGLVKDLAPKIDALYKNFKNLNRTEFYVEVNDPQVPGKWKPYVSFAVHRKLVEKVEWSKLFTDDFFRNVIDLKRFD